MKKTGLYWYVYDFSADYGNIDVTVMLDIPKNLLKKNSI